MSIIEIVILGVALAMDAFAVTISNAFCYRGASRSRLLMLPVAFGLFQGLMPLAGYFLGGLVGEIIEQYASIVTLVILGVIGGNMIKEGVCDLREARAARKAGEDPCSCSTDSESSLTLKVVIVQAIATSIDAFAVGVSLRAASVSIAEASVVIALTTFACCVVALALGKRFGSLLGERAEIVGGAVLVAIGVKALLS